MQVTIDEISKIATECGCKSGWLESYKVIDHTGKYVGSLSLSKDKNFCTERMKLKLQDKFNLEVRFNENNIKFKKWGKKAK